MIIYMILYDHNVAVPVPWIIMSNYAALISTLHTRNEHSKTIQSQDFATYHSANLLELVWYFDDLMLEGIPKAW